MAAASRNRLVKGAQLYLLSRLHSSSFSFHFPRLEKEEGAERKRKCEEEGSAKLAFWRAAHHELRGSIGQASLDVWILGSLGLGQTDIQQSQC